MTFLDLYEWVNMELHGTTKTTKTPDSEILCFLHYWEIQSKALTIKGMF